MQNGLLFLQEKHLLEKASDKGKDIAGNKVKDNNQSQKPGSVFHGSCGKIIFPGFIFKFAHYLHPTQTLLYFVQGCVYYAKKHLSGIESCEKWQTGFFRFFLPKS